MGGSDVLGVSTETLRGAATMLRETAATLGRQSNRIGEHAFGIGNDEAGRNYAPQGSAVHHGLERIAGCLHAWAASVSATADVFDRAAAEYDRLDSTRAAAVAGVHP
ncbi:type VII secretion target [Nocardia yamanashiensis]|uniref:type VII secretion target n=1 Tax=Nocardia yamanashiensis TaxID=209247 RepID=UPI00082E76DD|nr:type VII secretion target [Nocardia yamanashiensis]